MENKPGRRRSTLMMVSAMLIFGTIGVFRRHIPLSSELLSFSRGILGGLFLLAFTALRKGGARKKLPPLRLLQLSGVGVVLGLNWILLFEAYNYTTVAVATLCYYMQPTIVVLLSPLVFRERLTKRKAVCATVAVLGMVLISGVTGGGPQRGQARGILLGLGAAAFYSAGIMINKKIRDVDAYQKTIAELLSAGIVLIPYLLLTGGFAAEGLGLSAIALLLVVGIVHTGIAYVLYFSSMDGLSMQSVALLSYIDPASALLFSAVLLGEPLSVPGMIGAVMIIGSAAAGELQPAQE